MLLYFIFLLFSFICISKSGYLSFSLITHFLSSRAAKIAKLAATVPSSAGLFFVPAFSGLFAPHWQADARGVVVGLTEFSTKAHVGVSFVFADFYLSLLLLRLVV